MGKDRHLIFSSPSKAWGSQQHPWEEGDTLTQQPKYSPHCPFLLDVCAHFGAIRASSQNTGLVFTNSEEI